MANGEKGKGRSQSQRLKLFYLLEHTDENHTKKVSEIIEHFENHHKIPVEQKTVCSDLRLLTEYGYETQYDGQTRGWRIIEREFDTQELQLLIDSVQSSRFITQKKAKELTDKLKAKASRFDRVLLDRRCYVPNRVRNSNDSIFYHLDDLHAAIANDWKITFKYFYFTPKKQKAYCYPFVIENIANGRLKTDGIVSSVFPVEEWEKAYDAASGKYGDYKVAIKF